jgi:hypothetical protein
MLIINGHDKPALPREIEPVKVVADRLQDHGRAPVRAIFLLEIHRLKSSAGKT